MEVGNRFHATAVLLPESRIGGWVSRTAGLDILEKTEISYLYQESNPVLFIPQPSNYTDYTILVLAE